MLENALVQPTNPISYFIDQEGWWIAGILAASAVAYLILLSAVSLLLRQRIGESIKPFLTAVGISLVVFIAITTLYQGLAFYLRSEPPGSGLERQDRTFATLAAVGVWLIYVVVLALTWWLGQRITKNRRQSVWAVGTVLLFFVLTIPLVEFISQCSIGRGLGIPLGNLC